MKLECDGKGDFVVDHCLLTVKLAISSEELRRRMRLGLVTSVVEAGLGSDEGLRRLTIRCGNAVWRAIVDAQQNVVSEETFSLGGPAGRKDFR